MNSRPSASTLAAQCRQALSSDRIVYQVTSKGGGQDGMDPNDKGGKVILVTYDKGVAEQKIGLDSRFTIERQIVDDSDLRAAYAKLSPLDRFLIEQDLKPE